MEIGINTDKIVAIANTISANNMEISEELDRVKGAVNHLMQYWEGNASITGMNAFNNIYNTYGNNRYEVVENVPRFMKNCVAASYDNTEGKLCSAASRFK